MSCIEMPRPSIGTQYVGPDGEVVTIAATWQWGAVLADEAGCVSLADLHDHYTPSEHHPQRGNTP